MTENNENQQEQAPEEVQIPKMKRPSDTLEIVVNKEKQEIFMSSGLLRILVNYVNELDDVTAIYLNGKVQETCMLEALVKRDEKGKPETAIEELSLFGYEMSPAEGDKLAKWIGDHCLYFFINGAANMSEGIQSQNQTMAGLMQFLSGMNHSAQ